MTGVRTTTTSRAFSARDGAADRQKNQRVQSYDQSGRALIQATTTSDETTVTVTFVNIFVEMPTFTYGFEVSDTPTDGSWPTGSAFVLQWMTSFGPVPSYTGALIGVVSSGLLTQKLYIHYSFKGRAISVPATSQGVVGLVTL